jgi:hypothetical protein
MNKVIIVHDGKYTEAFANTTEYRGAYEFFVRNNYSKAKMDVPIMTVTFDEGFKNYKVEISGKKPVPMWRTIDQSCERGCGEFQCLACKATWVSYPSPSEWKSCPYCKVEWVREWTKKNLRHQSIRWNNYWGRDSLSPNWYIEVFGFRKLEYPLVGAHRPFAKEYEDNQIWFCPLQGSINENFAYTYPIENWGNGVAGHLKLHLECCKDKYYRDYPKRIVVSTPQKDGSRATKIIPWRTK